MNRAAAAPSLVDDLSRQLADEIVDGRVFPGARLDEQGLAQRFGVSRTPVREALRQLEAMGLVEKRPHRGVVVMHVPADKLAELFEAMAEMEATCARLAAERMSAAERRELEALHRRSAAHVVAGDLDGYEALNRDFHAAIYRGAHNHVVAEMALAVRRRVAPYRRAQFRVMGRLGFSLEEHDRVVQAILRGDADGAARAMRQHIGTVSDVSQRQQAGVRRVGDAAG